MFHWQDLTNSYAAHGHADAVVKRMRKGWGCVRVWPVPWVRRTEPGVVLLQDPRNVRVGQGKRNVRIALARARVGRVVDAGDGEAERDREGRLLRGELQLVKNHALQVTLALTRARQVGELLLPRDRTVAVTGQCTRVNLGAEDGCERRGHLCNP